MKNNFNLSEITKEISLLYELSLGIGQSLDLKTNCDIFLKILMARKNLGYVSVWLKNEYLTDLELSETKDTNFASLVYANPEYRVIDKTLSLNSSIFSMLANEKAFSLTSTDNDFQHLVHEKNITQGTFAVFALEDIGFLKIFSIVKKIPYQDVELNQLKNVFSKLAVSIKGCISHARVKKIEEQLKKLNEQLEEKVVEKTKELTKTNKELESFSYTISHDLRNPLNIIKGFSKILLDDYSDKLNDEGKDFLNNISTTAFRMDQTISALLKLSQITKGEIVFKEVNLSVLAESTANDLQSLQPERKIEFIITPDIIARADEGLIKVVLDNLIGNAWKYSSKTENAIIEFGVTQIDGKTTYFLKDNGAGFDMKYVEKLFTPFKRLHNNSEFEGTGIGLATVQKIINLHGGEIWAKSKVGEGAVFFFTIC